MQKKLLLFLVLSINTVYSALIENKIQDFFHKLPAEIQQKIIFDYYAKLADKIIYAYGYEKNPIIINNSPLKKFNFDLKTGEIMPNLYGIGIAFPELHKTEDNKLISLIGINSFMKRSKDLVSVWVNKN